MARLLDQVFGHKELVRNMLRNFSGARPGQTFLFVGPHGVGKKKVAVGFAQALLCETNRMACGQCPSCLRVFRGQHESLKILAPTGATIKIEDSREVISFLNLQSLSRRRVVIIDQAQLMNPQAANSLLKTLEEPPAETYFFLLAPSISAVLSTIRSRSRVISFKPLTEGEIRLGATGAPTWAIRASQGSFEKLAQLQDAQEIETRGQAFNILRDFVEDQNFLVENNWREFFKERSRSQRIFSYWTLFLRDVLYFKEEQKSSIMNVDQDQLLKVFAGKDIAVLLRLLDGAMRLEYEVSQNRDVSLMVEQFWIQERDAAREM